MTDKTITENWESTKSALLEGLEGQKKETMSAVLENTQTYLAEAATAGATGAGNVAALNKVILPVIRRVMPTVIANEIVGVQPMTGPVGQIHTLRVRYADSFNSTSGTDTTAGDEALSPFKIAEGYSGAADDKAASTSTLEGAAGNRLSIQVLKQTVEAKTRKLSARWTFESAQDANAMHGLDVEAEIMAALAQEITAEIDQEILGSLDSLATAAATSFDMNNVTGVGANIYLLPFAGTSYTNSVDSTHDAWQVYNSGYLFGKDATTTWYTTNDATLEITGVQLEVGSQATPFEHRSFGEEFDLCQRYYMRYSAEGVQYHRFAQGQMVSANGMQCTFHWNKKMRTTPTLGQNGSFGTYVTNAVASVGTLLMLDISSRGAIITGTSSGSYSAGLCVDLIGNNDTDAYLEFIAEL